MVIADLHIHSRHSRATAKSLNPENLWIAAQSKGISLLGTGDCTHPEWSAEVKEKLVESGDGAYVLRPEIQALVQDQVPGPCVSKVNFLITGEISSIYKRNGRTRKVHSLVIMPDFAAMERLNARLDMIGNIKSDGRPILGLDARDLLELCLEAEPQTIFIPAHIWTPWFSVFGSRSGFDSLEECFGGLLPHIHALETGLSSDPPMNWRLSALDRFSLVSNSDAHSPSKLGREANLLTCAPNFSALRAALGSPLDKGFFGTLEFFPDEGKYHLDGHRKCGVRLTPRQTRETGGVCPVCGKTLTVGVLSRIEELADRPEGAEPTSARHFESIIPLAEVMAEVMQRGPNTKGVARAVESLLHGLGPELFILRQASFDHLQRVGGELLAEAVRRMRAGEVVREGGYDGEFGVIRLFSPQEREEIKGQKGFWELAAEVKKKDKGFNDKTNLAHYSRAASQRLMPQSQSRESLNSQQTDAVEHRAGHLLLRAGPGTGKTRVLVRRAQALISEGVDPAAILMITFTRKAAAELGVRLGKEGGAGAKVLAGTFHSLGAAVLADALGRLPTVLDEQERREMIRPLAEDAGLKTADLAQSITLAKQRVAPLLEAETAHAYEAYAMALKTRGVFDLDDLVREAALRLANQKKLARAWRGRFEHILVDEYQDVNQAQVELLSRLQGPETTVCAIGDPDQAIYGFRGADSSFFQRFGEYFYPHADMGLSLNYRSASPILTLAEAIINGDPDPAPRVLIPRAGPGPLPVHCQLASPRAEAAWVARQVVRLLGGVDSRQVEGDLAGQGGSYGAADIAVLYRVHAQAPALAEALHEAGVPVQVAVKEPLGETDPMDFKAQRVSLLTMHASKGLEWPVVFITGLEDGLLPFAPGTGEPSNLDEERRLLFVALTRARERLYLTRAKSRSLYGVSGPRGASFFLTGLPPKLMERVKAGKRRRRARQLGLFV